MSIALFKTGLRGRAPRASHNAATVRCGALLLEVVVAMTILIAAMAFIGTQMVAGIRTVGLGEQETRLSELADRLLALLELDMQTSERLFTDRSTEGDFGDQYPEYSWQASVETTELPGLGQVTIEILYLPDTPSNPNDDEPVVVRRMYLLKADPGRIDFGADFGMNEEQLTQLSQTIPIPGFDPTQFNPQELVSQDPATLLQMLPVILAMLQQYTGGQGIEELLGPGGLEGATPDQIRELLAGQLGDLAGGEGLPGGEPGDEAGERTGVNAGLIAPPPGGGRSATGGTRRGGGGDGATRTTRGNRGGNGGRSGATGNNNRSGGANNRSGGTRRGGGNAADEQARIEELMRLRDQLNRGGGGDNGGGE
ncbi:MAG: hypothetical protein CHACPFDD_01693 [Phycisphaerae bacterium]|nr:hypothetical protein [Phycisphaerae bacterium]